jgi:hypothetical protein
VKLFNQKFDTVYEGLKDPKDNPCWTGYKPVGTKQKAGRTVPNCVPTEEAKKDKSPLDDITKRFMSYALKKLGIKKAPMVVFDEDRQRVNELCSMAGYMQSENKIWVYTGKRNAADIIRSLAHELVHCKQKESGRTPIDGTTGSEDENEANSVAGILLRTYGKQNPEIYE